VLLHELPSKINARGSPPPATQNDADEHDTELIWYGPSMLLGAPHPLPSKVNAFPLLSTATQNDADGQDTDKRECVPSMLAGALHELPLKLNAFPLLSTATQNDADGHDTEKRICPGSTGVGADQPLDPSAVEGAPNNPMITSARTSPHQNLRRRPACASALPDQTAGTASRTRPPGRLRPAAHADTSSRPDADRCTTPRSRPNRSIRASTPIASMRSLVMTADLLL
jgi:hypothetical protein